MKEQIIRLLEESTTQCLAEGLFEVKSLPFIELEVTRDESHGDYASNVAMVIASQARKNPRAVAQAIVSKLKDDGELLSRVEIAGPGFINFFVREERWRGQLLEIERLKERYGTLAAGKGRKVQVEFVSANPTGPLHIGHARGAVTGDVIANILRVSGHGVVKEYYINDVGNQMRTLGRSVYLRYREALGEAIEFPPDHYQGDYIAELARQILSRDGDRYRDRPEEEVLPLFTAYAAGSIMEGIKDDLAAFGVFFDDYFSEGRLYENDGVMKLLEHLREQGHVYREGGTLWFRSTSFGDEKDRVVIRDTGTPTYFAADIAYHKNKFDRGFDTVIDVWGADHHGYIPRLKASIEALGGNRDALRVILVQLVSLLRDGKPVAMSTRAGEYVTLRQVIDEVGKDAARYNFLMRRSDSQLDFDLEVAKRQSNENPVYYVQYAHARISSIIRMAADRGVDVPAGESAALHLLKLPEEIQLIKSITRYPEVIEGAAKALEPHRVTFFLNELAGIFHSYYNKNRVITDDEALSRARLFLVHSIGQVLRNALGVLGVSAPEKM
ncbi:MAG: arginine--tRNA ligase [Pseudomonadota bacterium]|jgi:arginyl-tRNA synthetase|nr:arginine--tRNA ligase [Pseudomonadota bacterium]NLX30227.1 arginine--tRNA ligase [Deltaproteobacteria bacterium]HNU84699.1 arginine--tRNA ligase [Syntrophales bacterium]HNZ33968.1 arginine--tRNA ligase [Syntrophales bacterium]HOF73119.1 arginine--tRNA ligase [Syntrophales bacterium]